MVWAAVWLSRPDQVFPVSHRISQIQFPGVARYPTRSVSRLSDYSQSAFQPFGVGGRVETREVGQQDEHHELYDRRTKASFFNWLNSPRNSIGNVFAQSLLILVQASWTDPGARIRIPATFEIMGHDYTPWTQAWGEVLGSDGLPQTVRKCFFLR
jgi:hypothetical protein